MKDFLGREYGVGDLVIYGASSDRSINMVIGRVTAIKPRMKDDYEYVNDKFTKVRVPVTDRDDNPLFCVQVQPLRSSRWKQHYGSDYYIDTRSGKRFNPWSEKGFAKATRQESGWYKKETGEKLADDCDQAEIWSGRGFYRRPEPNPNWVPADMREYKPHEFHDWVERRNDGAKPVSITVTENIVKWDGELPGE